MAHLHGRWRQPAVVGHGARVLFLTQGTIMAASYAVVGEPFRADTPQIWSPTSIQGSGLNQSAYDLHPDGKRVAAAVRPDQASVVRDKVVFVSNFGDYLRSIAPGTK